MGVSGPCKLCRDLAEIGALGLGCNPMRCPCKCHSKSRLVIQRETQKYLGVDNKHIINEIKHGIPNPMENRRPKKKVYDPTHGPRSMTFGRL